MEDMTFIKITADNRELYLFTTLKDEGYDLIITDCQDFWSGTVLKKANNRQCSDFQPLTRTSHQNRTFDYEINNLSNGEEILFKWKEKNVVEKSKFTLGSTTLNKVEDIRCITQKIFDHCIHMISNINQEITSAKEEKEMLLGEKADTRKRLDKLVGAKETLEQELYSKFLVVLNSKKTEIYKLREKVKHLESKDLKRSESEESDSKMETSPSSSIYEQETQVETEPKPMLFEESSDEEISLASRQNLKTHYEEKKRAKIITTASSSVSLSSSNITTKTISLPRKRSVKKNSPKIERMSPTQTLNPDNLLDDM